MQSKKGAELRDMSTLITSIGARDSSAINIYADGMTTYSD
jgi:hypothetical protein